MFWRRKPKRQIQFLAFGLGNPGVNYARTRHNVGWWVLDELARKHGVDKTGHRHKGQVDYCKINDVSCALVKPTTFMNRSGTCVAAWLREFPEAKFAVVLDDISMNPGKLRLRSEGSSGGHKGVQSIIDTLRTKEFDRIKVGVGHPGGEEDAADYVLQAPTSSEEELIAPNILKAADALASLATGDRQAAILELAQQSQS